MNTLELQHNLIKRILDLKDNTLLEYLNIALSKENSIVEVTDYERQFLDKSEQDYKNGNIISDEEVRKEITEWLEE
ncbi:MAG: hypothetical protein GXO79_14355 [Chlorobi bacterium]|nr:hypothetical protein [Chlorobiota bacterium]